MHVEVGSNARCRTVDPNTTGVCARERKNIRVKKTPRPQTTDPPTAARPTPPPTIRRRRHATARQAHRLDPRRHPHWRHQAAPKLAATSWRFVRATYHPARTDRTAAAAAAATAAAATAAVAAAVAVVGQNRRRHHYHHLLSVGTFGPDEGTRPGPPPWPGRIHPRTAAVEVGQ